MKPVNTHRVAVDLRRGDLWLRPLPEGDTAVVLVTKVEKFKDEGRQQRMRVTYDVNWSHANDASYTEAIPPFENVQVLILQEAG